jgi:hypothetical protein
MLLNRMSKRDFTYSWDPTPLLGGMMEVVLFERLEAYKKELSARGLSMRDEYQIDAEIRSRREILSASADYVLGYELYLTPTVITFEGIYTVIVRGNIDSIQRVIAFMVGVQQERMCSQMPERISDSVYAIFVFGGDSWKFLQLDGKKLLASKTLRFNEPTDRLSIYGYVDAIIKGSIALDISLYGAEPRSPTTLKGDGSMEQGHC